MIDLATQDRIAWLARMQAAMQWAEQINETRALLVTPERQALRRITGTVIPFRRRA